MTTEMDSGTALGASLLRGAPVGPALHLGYSVTAMSESRPRTPLDLLKLMGFEQLTVTDGDRYAHQILIK